MTGYVKLMRHILTSTIWREDDKTRILWVTMLALQDRNYIVNASVPGLADQAHISVDDCVKALEILKAPDTWSRTKDHDGKRIQEVQGGWLILNGESYAKMYSAEERREYKARKEREYRNMSTDVHGCPRMDKMDTQENVHLRNENGERTPPVGGGGCESENSEEQPSSNGTKPSAFDAFWEAYPRKVAKAEARKAFDRHKLGKIMGKVLSSIGAQKQTDAWTKEGGKFIPHPATWINQGRWEDDITSLNLGPNLGLNAYGYDESQRLP